MKRIAAIALVAAFGLIPAGRAVAQEHVDKVAVPFSFSVNGNVLPAGEYVIGSSKSNMITIREREKGVNVWALTEFDGDDTGKRNVMVFHKVGDQYFLREIRGKDAALNVYLPLTGQEKRAKVQNQATVVQSNSDVLVAMK
jgi:hypothetical protein